MALDGSLSSRCQAALIGGCYFAAAAIALQLTRFDGGVALLWPANAILLSALVTKPPACRPRIIACCLAAAILAAAIFGLGPRAAVPMGMLNVTEAVIGAGLMRRLDGDASFFQSLRSFAIFALAAGIVAPLVTGLPAALVVHSLSDTPFWVDYGHWAMAHGLGAAIFAPTILLVMQGEFRSIWRGGRRVVLTTSTLIASVAAITTFVFVQTSFPLLFLLMLPLVATTFRLGPVGAALSILIVATIGTLATVHDLGPISLIHGSASARTLFFQFFLATAVMTALPVAAELGARDRLLARLRESEARFRLLTDNSADAIFNVSPAGVILYASPAVFEMAGLHPEDLVGEELGLGVIEADMAAVHAAHAHALASPEETISYEYRAIGKDGSLQWFENRTRGYTDEGGEVSGVVNLVRDISRRKRRELDLKEQASTDELTGLVNRRAFLVELERTIAQAQGGCLAIFDVDHFKRVNDTLGHAAGDAVLVALAEAARVDLRAGDVLARLGGEEFGLILQGIDLAGAEAVCERLRARVAARRVAIGDEIVSVTLSAGVAAIGEGTAGELLRAADRALYAAKAAGRDRLRLAA